MSQYTRWPANNGGGGGGTGTVTFVGLTAPSILTVSGSPITTSGTLVLGLATQSANQVFAGPTSGPAATPTFRALVASDVPALSYVSSVSGSSPIISSGGLTPTISIQQANGSQNGFLSSTDWNTFNNKQASGNYITALTGDVTASGPGSAASTIANSAVSNAKMADMANNTVKGNKSGGSSAPSDLTLSSVTESVSSVLTISNGSNVIVGSSNLTIQVKQASASQSGYLSATDFQTFASGLSGANIDGGTPSTIYGGVPMIDGGTP